MKYNFHFFYIKNNCFQDSHPGCTQWKLETHYLKYHIQNFICHSNF